MRVSTDPWLVVAGKVSAGDPKSSHLLPIVVARAKHVAGTESFAGVHWHGTPFCWVKPQYCALSVVACEQSVFGAQVDVDAVQPHVPACVMALVHPAADLTEPAAPATVLRLLMAAQFSGVVATVQPPVPAVVRTPTLARPIAIAAGTAPTPLTA